MTALSESAPRHVDTLVSVAGRTSYTDGLRAARVVLHVATRRSMELVDLTDQVAAAVADTGLREGWVDVFCRHTSCGLLVNENESGLREDLRILSGELVTGHPARLWNHDDMNIRTENLVDGERPNAHSHLLTMMFTSPDLKIWVENGLLDLGRWQRLMLAEFDGPRPDLDLPPGTEPTHPVRQVVLNLCSSTTPIAYVGGPRPERNGKRP